MPGTRKKPSKLKPLRNTSKSGVAKDRSNWQNIAEKFINDDEAEKAAILAEKRDEIEKINDDLDDFMNVAAGGFTNIKDLNDAFEGKNIDKPSYDIVYDDKEPGGIKLKKGKRKTSVRRNAPKTA